MSIGKRIKEIRKREGLTLEKFGRRIGIAGPSVSLLESGKNNPSAQTIRLICSEFHIDAEWLRTGEGEMAAEKDKADRLAEWAAQVSMENDTARRRIVDALVALPEDQWEVLYEFAKKIVDGEL